MNLNVTAILIASLAQFVFGAVWYTPVFGKLWGKIHGHDKLTKAEQQMAVKTIGPLLGIQFVVTVVTTVVFSILLQNYSGDVSAYCLALYFWLGFVVPTQVSAVMFGGTETKWIVTKILVMAGGSLGCIMIAAAILQAM